jgi:hypothetical protein
VRRDHGADLNHWVCTMSDLALTKSGERELPVYVKPARLSIAQTADYLGSGERHIWLLIKAGELEVVGTPRKRWIITSSIDAYIARQPRLAPSKKSESA